MDFEVIKFKLVCCDVYYENVKRTILSLVSLLVFLLFSG